MFDINAFKRRLLFLCFLVFVAGCTSPISQQYRDQASSAPAFHQALITPEPYYNSTVVWGGEIISTTNNAANTDIIVLQEPLGLDTKPGSPSESEGRFIARVPGFLDPAVYSSGRKITVAGTIAGKESRPVGAASYAYPIVQVKQSHLWDLEPAPPEPLYYYGPYYDYAPYYDWPYYDYYYWPYYWPYYYGPYSGSFFFSFEHGGRFEGHGHGGGGGHGGHGGGGHH